jgi:hypothetical protein
MAPPPNAPGWVVALLVALVAAGCGGSEGGSGSQPSQPVASYVHLQSDTGDFIGGGQSFTYTRQNAQIAILATGGRLSLSIAGGERWSGDFQVPAVMGTLQPGTYANLTRIFHDPAQGGLDWSGEGRSCSTLVGSFTVDRVAYAGGALAAIDMRFEQHCEGATPALRGQIHWTSGDTSAPPGPDYPPPAILWRPAPGSTPPSGNYVYLQSDAGDYIGAGQTYIYTQASATISASASGGRLSVAVNGGQKWTGDFQAMSSVGQPTPGYYGDLERYPFQNPLRGGLAWSGEGRDCSTLTGWFAVDDVTYTQGTLTGVDLRFEQHCEGGGPALHGQLHWEVGPEYPPPAGLWQPAPGSTPASGSFVFLQSDEGDYIGGGQTYLYTRAGAVLSVSASGGHLSVAVNGDQQWTGDFQTMSSIGSAVPGYYGDLQRYPFNSPTRGALRWAGEGRDCATLTGWFVVDGIAFSGSTLTAIDLRFEQHCEGGGPALRGQIHWAPPDTTAPEFPPPLGLWQPAPGSTPATGNYLYLESEPGDSIGAGQTYLYTQATAVLSVTASGGYLAVKVNGDQWWVGDFQAMAALSQLEPGYYAGLERYPFQDPLHGGLSWTGENRGCNTLTGWFTVDDVAYTGSTLVSIDLRFEQHCDGAAPAVHGRIHWAPGDTTAPPGPVDPPPAGLWQPVPGSTPPSGNYVYLQSDAGEYIGAGQTFLYTQATAVLSVTASVGGLWVGIDGDEYWTGVFQAMNTLTQLEPGYYGNLMSALGKNNPARGGLSWFGEGRGCSESGWFTVDSATYVAGVLTAIDLRFEQHCDGTAPALHGLIHWDSSDTTAPPGPVYPPPDGLWQPAPGSTPASGNYVYLKSDPGDFIGAGQTYLYTQATALLSVDALAGRVSVGVRGDEYWDATFQAMSTLVQLEPGYYGSLQGYPFHNPARGGLDWSGQYRGCNTLTGWFTVDSVTYVAGALAAIDLRFEQHCGGGTPALHGQIHWDSSDTTAPPGPVYPLPAGLWAPTPGSTPESGNYVYLESDAGDYIGGGQTYLYTPATADMSFFGTDAYLLVGVNGTEHWGGSFVAMHPVTQLSVAYYGNAVQHTGSQNPTRPAIDWSGEGRGCNTLTGWFTVDSVTYSGTTIAGIDLRFEQVCWGSVSALHGKIHWAP